MKSSHFEEFLESEKKTEDAADCIIDIAKELHLTIDELDIAMDKVKKKAYITDYKANERSINNVNNRSHRQHFMHTCTGTCMGSL